MRELSAYYCKKCGHYAYYQLAKNAICHKCNHTMTLLDIPYQDFMDLDYEERDRLVSGEILKSAPSFVQRITAPGKKFNQREIIGKLSDYTKELEEENQKLESAVTWMHETIWNLIRKNRALSSELETLRKTYGKE